MKARGIKAFEANDPHKGSLFLKYKMNFILQICLFYISNNLKFKIKKKKNNNNSNRCYGHYTKAKYYLENINFLQLIL